MSGTVGILGAGSWGTALAVHLARAGRPVRLWARRPELAEELARERINRAYLPEVELPGAVEPCSDLAALTACDPVLVVVPSHGFRKVVRGFLEAHPGERPVTLVSAAKGIETDTLARMSQVCFEEGVARGREVHYAVVSGPTFASELAVGMPTAAVVASEVGTLAQELRELLATPWFRLYSSSDVAGVELGGAAKNVIAIAAGVVTGLGYGHNTLAALITRGLHEVTRLGLACGGQPRTFAGLAGLGDLVLTCTGEPSRNRSTGLALARGEERAERSGGNPMVAEGVRNSLAVRDLARRKGVEMPITDQMAAVIHEGRSPREAVEELMTRELKAEAEL